MCTDCGCSITDHHNEHEYTHSTKSSSHQAAHETLHHNPQLNDAKTISVIKKILDKMTKKLLIIELILIRIMF